MKEWERIDREFKEAAPVRFFLVRVAWPKFRRTVRVPRRFLYWIRYRTTDRYHVVRTGLAPGYQDFPERMLHANFSMLVDYVEIELGSIQGSPDTAKRPKPLLEKVLVFFLLKKDRDREEGLRHLAWECSLDDPSNPDADICRAQAVNARTVLKLYKWWTEERPNRKEPKCPIEGYEMPDHKDWTIVEQERHQVIRDWNARCAEANIYWDEEDDEMLKELVSVRQSLWT